MTWEHILNLYEDDISGSLYRCRKLTFDHVHLTPQSMMKVNLAVQVRTLYITGNVIDVLWYHLH